MPISRWADSSESEPCTRFSVNSVPRSPRIVPGAASRGLVAPIIVRTTFHVSSGPSSTKHQRGAAADELHQLVVERLALVLLVVPAGGLGVDGAQLGGDEGEALALEPADDLADEAAFDGVGLADDEGAIHGAAR